MSQGTHTSMRELRGFRLWLLTGGGLGFSPMAPGTVGSLPAVAFALLAVLLLNAFDARWISALSVNLAVLLLAVLFTFACIRYGWLAEQRFRYKDPQAVVADELAGQSVALLFLSWREFGEPGAVGWNLMIAGIAFVAFRTMDILKPPPCRAVQRLPAGAGIVCDDLIAGGYALMITQIITRLLM